MASPTPNLSGSPRTPRYPIAENNARHILHPMVDPKVPRANPPLVIERGEGCYVWDLDGRRYLDCVAGLWNVNVGHGRPEIKEAIVKQLDRIAYYATFQNHSNPPSIELSARLMELFATEGMQRVLFSSGGSDANETALKLARQYWKLVGEPDRVKIISLKYAYHGVHYGVLSANGNPPFRHAYEPLMPNFFQIETPFWFRSPFPADSPEELGRLCAAQLESEIQKQGAGTVAAFIAEPIQGAGGVIVPPPNFWPLVRAICDRYGVLLIADEVVTAFGRPGSMSGARLWGVKPDIMAVAKGINSGYVPLGATMLNERVTSAWDKTDPLAPIMHGYTYSGHPLACAAANAALEIVEREDLPGNAARMGHYLHERLADFPNRYAFVGEVRGVGLMRVIEFVKDKATRTPWAPTDPLQRRIIALCKERGAIVRVQGTRMILSPPLIINRAQIDEMVAIFTDAFNTFQQELD